MTRSRATCVFVLVCVPAFVRAYGGFDTLIKSMSLTRFSSNLFLRVKYMSDKKNCNDSPDGKKHKSLNFPNVD
jgi:hypothetical protein